MLRSSVDHSRRSGPLLPVLAAILLIGPTLQARAQGDNLERQLLKAAPKVIEHLRSKGYRSVGVLKFRIKKGAEPISDRVGTLNSFLADRLETALILANPNDEAKQVGIIQRASDVAAKLRGASHLSSEGRQRLFAAKYPVAWGARGKTVTPDAFVTGVVQISPDLRDMTVGILVFDKSGNRLAKAVPVFTANTNARLLAEIGESFLLRGGFDQGELKLVNTKAVDDAAKIKSQQSQHPLADPSSPITLEVRYDGRVVPLEFRDGKAFVREPRQGQKVELVMKRQGTSHQRLAVVLKVNGENTLYRQRKRAIDCNKWVFSPTRREIALRGYQQDDNTAEEFKVLSPAESKAREVDYGRDVGTISLVVFQELKDKPTPKLPSEEEEDLLAMLRGAPPKEKPLNLAALKFQLRESGSRGTGTRGLIAEGQQTKFKVRNTTFTADPTPLMTATVVYYQPQ